MSKVPLSKLRDVSKAAKDVIDSGSDRGVVSPNDSSGMVQLYDWLNDVAAPPEIVKAMADELINLRQEKQRQYAQRILDRRRFANLHLKSVTLQEVQAVVVDLFNCGPVPPGEEQP